MAIGPATGADYWGCVIDKAAVLAAGTYPATWVATTPGRALVVSTPAFRAMLSVSFDNGPYVTKGTVAWSGTSETISGSVHSGGACAQVSFTNSGGLQHRTACNGTTLGYGFTRCPTVFLLTVLA